MERPKIKNKWPIKKPILSKRDRTQNICKMSKFLITGGEDMLDQCYLQLL